MPVNVAASALPPVIFTVPALAALSVNRSPLLSPLSVLLLPVPLRSAKLL